MTHLKAFQMHLRVSLRRSYQALLTYQQKARGSLWGRDIPVPPNKMGLDIGCGPRKRRGFLGVDKYFAKGVDVVCDLEDGRLPFAANTFDVINASHVLEHVQDLDGVLAETARVMKPGAKLQISLPYAGDLRAFQDPTHVRFFTLKTFEYYVREGARVGAWYQRRYFRCVARRHLVFGSGPLSLLMALLVNRSQGLLDLYEASVLRVIPARGLHIELEK